MIPDVNTINAIVGMTSHGPTRHGAKERRPMIRCIPRGICSWNFLLDGVGHKATLKFNALNEQGAITVDGIRFEVRKHGMLSGHWTLNHQADEVASAQKSNAFSRTFVIEDPSGEFILRAAFALGRSFRLERSGELVATMIPDHAFTRRATIEIFAEKWDLPTVCFSFWLVALMWRRAAQNNSS